MMAKSFYLHVTHLFAFTSLCFMSGAVDGNDVSLVASAFIVYVKAQLDLQEQSKCVVVTGCHSRH